MKVKFIYSEKVTKFCEISTNYLFYVLPLKYLAENLQNFVAFSEYMNVIYEITKCAIQAFLDFRGFDFNDFRFNAVYNSILFSSPLVLLSNLDLCGFCIPGLFYVSLHYQRKSRNACNLKRLIFVKIRVESIYLLSTK